MSETMDADEYTFKVAVLVVALIFASYLVPACSRIGWEHGAPTIEESPDES